MENTQPCKTALPEELVGRIMAMVPFPSIFKARALLKSWLARFSPIASLEDEEEKRHANLFQKEVAEQSQKWETPFSIIFGKKLSLASDWATGNRSRLPSLAFLPERFQVIRSNPGIEGPLLYGCVRSNQLIYVANILTRSWRKLPPHLDAGGSTFCWKKLVIEASLKTYKLIVLCRNPQNILSHIYDSKSHSWTCKKLVAAKNFKTLSTLIFLNGVLYMVADRDLKFLLAFDVEKETLRDISLSFTNVLSITSVALVVCNANLLMIVTEGVSSEGLHVLKIDLKSQQLFEVARGPPAAFNLSGFRIRQPVGDGDSIFFGITFQGHQYMRMVAYNVNQDQWRCFAFPDDMSLDFQIMSYNDWCTIASQPGLNPFLEV